MNLYEARNNYEVLVSLILAGTHEGDSTILSDRFASQKVGNITLKKVSFGNNFFKKFLYYMKWRKYSKCDAAYIFHEISPFSVNQKINKRVLVQHGYINYLTGLALVKNAGIFYTLRKLFLLEKMAVGTGKSINEVYLTNLDRAPEILKGKLKLLNLDELFSSLKPEVKKFINELFKFNLGEVDTSKTDLLLTQPLSEQCLVTEQRKIEIYKSVIDAYPNVIIKPHPHELTDYASHFENYVLERKTPVELYNLNTKKFHRVITIFSSGIDAIDAKEKIQIGTESFPDLLKKAGSL